MSIQQAVHSFIKQNAGFFRYPGVFILALIVASSELFGEALGGSGGAITPLAIALIGSVSGADTIFVFLGSLAAFLSKGQLFEAATTLALMLVVGGFRFFVVGTGASSPPKSYRLLDLSTVALTVLSVGTIGAITAARPSDIVAALVAALACGVLAFALLTVMSSWGRRRRLEFESSGVKERRRLADLAAHGTVGVFAAAMLTNLSLVYELPVNIALAIGAAAALALMNSTGRVGAVVGALAAAGAVCVAPEFAASAVIFAAALPVSSLAAKYGKASQGTAFVFAVVLGTAVTGLDAFALSTLLSGAVGAVLFMAMPQDAAQGLALRLFGSSCAAASACDPDSTSASRVSGGALYSGGIKSMPAEIFAQRLRLASDALCDVKSAVEKAGEILDKRNTKDVSWVYNTAGETVCRRCKFNMVCWGEEYSNTIDALNKMTLSLRKGEPLRV
ncbi:MAG: hypothetical protein FWD35_01680, partial [Oscillospiraceae bacterium]|nr:hypothetical protein [Oscillospiraceae bacterium]